MELWSSGDVLRAQGRGGTWSRGGGMEVLRYGAPELVRHAAGAGTWRRRGMELQSSRGALQARRRGSVEVWSSRAPEVCCRCRDVEEA